jgi:N-acetylneuraminic acid mutarotase
MHIPMKNLTLILISTYISIMMIAVACKKDEATPITPVTPTTATPTTAPTITAFIPEGWKTLEKFPGGERSNAVAFTIGEKMYVGLGYSSLKGFSKVADDFYEYDPATNKWKSIAQFPGKARANAIVFVVNNKAYVGLGTNYDRISKSDLYTDFYEYDPTKNEWTAKANFAGTTRNNPVYFTIGENGYFGTGNPDPFFAKNTNEFWQYNAKKDEWTKKAPLAGLNNRTLAFGFAVGGKGYIGGGEDENLNKLRDINEYDPITDKWSQKGFFPERLSRGRGFAIGDIGYVAGGILTDPDANNSLYKYDAQADTWSLSGAMAAVNSEKKGRFFPSCIPFKGKAYIGIGSLALEGDNLTDFYEVTLK